MPRGTRNDPKAGAQRSVSRQPQGRYWILTIPVHCFLVYLPRGVVWLTGQLEEGAETGYRHWQMVACFAKKVRLGGVKGVFGDQSHCELTRSEAAVEYCTKSDTAIEGTRFELGTRPFNRNSDADWKRVRTCAQEGRLDEIPSDIYVRFYGNIRKIMSDHIQPRDRDVEVICYYGPSGVGKSSRCRRECKGSVYYKDPSNRWWDGYNGQDCVIVDEYAGGFALSNLLRWTDKYGVVVEVKGGSVELRALQIFFTCNINPREWYKDCTEEHWKAIQRRIKMVECPVRMY